MNLFLTDHNIMTGHPAKRILEKIMKNKPLLLGSIILCLAFTGWAQTLQNYGVQLSAATQTNPPAITLFWGTNAYATRGYVVQRKMKNDVNWIPLAVLGANATSFTDPNVVVGTGYEYSVSAQMSASITNPAVGYIYAGMNLPLVESRGGVILLIDNTFTNSLAFELARLQQDLVGDGWTVITHVVPRMMVDPANTNANVGPARALELNNVKNLVAADYYADTNDVNTVFILGHVPVPYAGDISPDGLATHKGAWPADCFYGDMSDIWTDSNVNDASASNKRNFNVPGDGKFDNSTITSEQLAVGRVDFAGMTAFTNSEVELLRQYLNKDHNYRQGSFTVTRQGLIDDNFGVAGGVAPGKCGWNNLSALLGPANVKSISGWFANLNTNSSLWAYASGPGTDTSVIGIGTAANYVNNSPKVVFLMEFGSWFGDWNVTNNFLRAPLCSGGYTLTCSWSGYEPWVYHHMALGESIGYDARWSQNNGNGSTYSGNNSIATQYSQYVNMGLMGDPTLREDVLPALPALNGQPNGTGGISLSWPASPATNAVLGYNLYKAVTAAGPFARVNPALIYGTNYTDTITASAVYMVRPERLETNNAGSYYNSGEGAFYSLAGSPSLPSTGFYVLPAWQVSVPAPGNVMVPAALITANSASFSFNIPVGDSARIVLTNLAGQALQWDVPASGSASVLSQTPVDLTPNSTYGGTIQTIDPGTNLSAAASLPGFTTPALVPPTNYLAFVVNPSPDPATVRYNFYEGYATNNVITYNATPMATISAAALLAASNTVSLPVMDPAGSLVHFTVRAVDSFGMESINNPDIVLTISAP